MRRRRTRTRGRSSRSPSGWRAIGLAAPKVLAADLDQGLLLLEDFGDARMREALDAEPEARARALRDGDGRPGPSARPSADARTCLRTGSTNG